VTRKKRIVIIGAGPTGLGAAHRLKELGHHDFVVLDAASEAGGLSRSFVDPQGFTWDIGGHVQFSHYTYFDDVMLEALGQDGWFHHQREAWARMFGRWVPYPVQNNLRHFPTLERAQCVQGLVALYRQGTSRPSPHNFSEWIDATFGQGLAEIFMRPYNLKVWAYPPEQLSSTWVGERVAVTDLARVLNNILLEKDDVSWGPNNTFQFPKQGGTGAVWTAVARRVGLEFFRFGAVVSSIDSTQQVVRLSTGEVLAYDALISTMPVDRFMASVDPVSGSAEALEAARGLKHSTTHVVGLGLAGQVPPALATKCWVYFPEHQAPFYRATVFSNYSPAHVPDARRFWSLMTETSESPVKPVSQQTLVEDTIAGAIATGLIESPSQVVSTWHHRTEYGYPTPSVDRDQRLGRVHPFLEPRNIFSRGRFGGWKYEVSNQDHSMMQGVEIVNRLLLKVPETTYPFPNTANANWGKTK
jgi:protoporphyrinogen oxidase